MGSPRLAAGGPCGAQSHGQHRAVVDAPSASAKVRARSALPRPGSPPDCGRSFPLPAAGPGPLPQHCLCPPSPPALPGRRGAEGTTCAAAPEVKHLCFAQGVRVSVSTESDKRPLFFSGLDAGSGPGSPRQRRAEPWPRLPAERGPADNVGVTCPSLWTVF